MLEMTEFDDAIAETVEEDMPCTGDDVQDLGMLLWRLPEGHPYKRMLLRRLDERADAGDPMAKAARLLYRESFNRVVNFEPDEDATF
jgi:hypothetical protein